MLDRVFIRTLGCQMNVYDSQSIIELLEHSFGSKLTDKEQEADILIVNTCSIREKAQEKVFHQLGRWKKFKNKNKNIIIGVVGCVASQEGENIFKRANYVDFVLGPQAIHKIPQAISKTLELKSKKRIIDLEFNAVEKFDSLKIQKVTGPEAFVTIMEGCSKHCTFCVVPNTRGAEVSRATQDILREVDLLSQEGVKEVTLLGQNVNSYSYEYLDADNNLVEVNFALLLRYVAKNTNITRIRFFTSHPIDFTDELIEVFRDEKKLVSHLHLPVQSGSDNILSLMKRQHNIEFYKKIIDKLRQVRPDIYFSSDFIVGFPNETEEDFKATLELIKYVGYDLSFSFIYSPRPGTYAMDMEDNTALDIKKDRLIRIQQLLKEQTDAVVESMIGSVQRVLVNGFSKRNLDSMQGRSENNRIIHFPAVNPSLIGKILDIEITRSSTNCLLGKMV